MGFDLFYTSILKTSLKTSFYFILEKILMIQHFI